MCFGIFKINLKEKNNKYFYCAINKKCAEYSSVESKRMLSEVSRVLTKKGGIYMCITYGVKDHRLKYLDDVSFKKNFIIILIQY